MQEGVNNHMCYVLTKVRAHREKSGCERCFESLESKLSKI